MKKTRRSVTIMVHQDGALDSRSIRVPLWLLRLGAITGSVVLGLIVLAAVVYAPIARTAARVPALEREIDRLAAENVQVQELAGTLADLEAGYDQVRAMLGASVLPDRARSGGSLPVAFPVAAQAPGQAPGGGDPKGTRPDRWPVDERGIVTRGPVTGNGDRGGHAGLDIAIPTGTPIRAAGGGRVTRAGEDVEYGLYVRIQHIEGYESMYGHASRLLVVEGDSVRSGQVVALSGSTGRSTAPHLHFEILQSGRSIDPRTMVKEAS